jgi:hypothetical protein
LHGEKGTVIYITHQNVYIQEDSFPFFKPKNDQRKICKNYFKVNKGGNFESTINLI